MDQIYKAFHAKFSARRPQQLPTPEIDVHHRDANGKQKNPHTPRTVQNNHRNDQH